MKKVILDESILDIDKWLPRKDAKTRVHSATTQHPYYREKCRCDVVWMRMRLGQVARDRAALVSYIIVVT